MSARFPSHGLGSPTQLIVRADDVSACRPEYVFERRTFEVEYGVSADDHDAEFAAYRSRSLLVSVVDAHLQVLGVMRLIRPGDDPTTAPIKTFVEAALEPWWLDVPRSVQAANIDVSRTWDVATLAVDRSIGVSRGIVLGALHHALFKLAEHRDIHFLTMTVDERVRATMRMLGLAVQPLPGAAPRPFCGSKASTPAWGRCTDMLTLQRQVAPDAHRLTTVGVGLGAVEFPDWRSPSPESSVPARATAEARSDGRLPSGSGV